MAATGSPFLALLRGINVGGKNIIPKEALKECFEDCGFDNVRTYIQSGNILFRSQVKSTKQLVEVVQARLSERFAYEAQATILSKRQYRSALQAAPATWGKDDTRKHNALFTLHGVRPDRLMAQLPPPKDGIESVAIATGVIYWSISKQHQTKTTLMSLAKSPVYQQVTVRNHNTVLKLLELFDLV